MFDFFGTFLDGPFAGMSFGATVDGGDGGGGAILALFGVAFVFTIVLFVVGYIVLSPFLTWKLLFEGESIVAIAITIFAQLGFILFRIVRCVRHWHAGFVKELLINTAAWYIVVLLCGTVFLIPLFRVFLGEEVTALLMEHYVEFVLYFLKNFITRFFYSLLLFIPLSVIPATLTTVFSNLIMRRVEKVASKSLVNN